MQFLKTFLTFSLLCLVGCELDLTEPETQDTNDSQTTSALDSPKEPKAPPPTTAPPPAPIRTEIIPQPIKPEKKDPEPEPTPAPSPIQPEFSDELLQAVNNWRKIPQSVFPLSNVSIREGVVFQLIGKQNEIMASTPYPAGKEVVVKAVSGETLYVSPTIASKLQATIPMANTDFKQCVAFRYEMGKKVIEMRERLRKERALNAEKTNSSTDSSATTDAPSDLDELPVPGDFGHGKFCICSDCREKRLALTGSMK